MYCFFLQKICLPISCYEKIETPCLGYIDFFNNSKKVGKRYMNHLGAMNKQIKADISSAGRSVHALGITGSSEVLTECCY